MVTVPTTEAPPRCGPKLESLTHIDITKLSQSELRALSLCSDSAFDLRRTDDVVTPPIDRSLFNESAGSRRQTYSRHHQSSSTVAGLRCRLPGLLPKPRTLPSLSPDDPEHAENKSIVNFLKQFITDGKTEAHPQPAASGKDMQMVLYSGEKKRKRERKPNPVVPISNVRLEIVNKNGVVVDLKALENADELYGAELRRRSVGLESEEEFLRVLGNLEGQWGSRRKKRRIVDACEFGDWLPIGWKLLLALKRKEGRVSVYCRRYISPNGQQFASCKEASSFLQSYFGLNDASQQLDQTGDNNHQCADVLHKNGCITQDSVPNSTVHNPSIPHVKEMEFTLMGIENLPEVQVLDLFECYKCNMTFDEKHLYLEHLMSFHQRTTRRYRLGSSIGEGVIIKGDGNYECQICHKVFQERRSYNGHVGVHVRNHVRQSEELPAKATVLKRNESPSQDKLPTRISKMDALIEIAQSSILENSSAEPNDKASGGSSPHRLEAATVPEHHAVNSDHELASDPNELELEDCMTKGIPDQGFNQNYVRCIISDKEKVNSVDISHATVPEHHAVNSDYELASDPNELELEDCMTKGIPDQGFNQNYSRCIISDKEKVNSVDISHATVPEHHAVNSDYELASDPNELELEDCMTKGIPDQGFNQNYARCIISDKEKVNSVGMSHATVPEHHAVNSDHELASDPNELELEDCMTKSIPDQGFDQNYARCITSDKEKVNSVGMSHATVPEHHAVNSDHELASHVENNVMAVCNGTSEHTKLSEVEKHGNSEQDIGLDSQLTPSHDVVTWSSGQTVKENVVQSGVAESSMTMMQSLDCFLSSGAISNKAEDEFCTVYQKLDNVTDFDELRLEEMERLQFSFMNRQESPPFPGVSMNVANDEVMEEVFNSSARFESEAVMLNIDTRRQFTTVCVWCRMEFNHEAFESETQSDSVGFMCPSCKAKISGQLNVLDGGLSMNYRL